MHYTDHELRIKATEVVEFYRKLGNDIFSTNMPKLNMDFSLKGTTAGQFSPKKNAIRVNLVLFNENYDDYVENTLPHEVAHAVNRHLARLEFGIRRKPHGYEWKRIMRAFGKEPSVGHSYDVSNARQKKWDRPFLYRCACQDHEFTATCHKRVKKGTRYKCKRCGQLIHFIEEKS